MIMIVQAKVQARRFLATRTLALALANAIAKAQQSCKFGTPIAGSTAAAAEGHDLSFCACFYLF